ncbi:ABC transporter substrate-binding protein [Xanthobacter autotrophicus DSM 431]|uniref:ABC transporter substrate-binding protein n=1 Tax=Xanthobacter nonsaccharivorans TaxID=3119912 RepID=UPI00372A7DB2
MKRLSSGGILACLAVAAAFAVTPARAEETIRIGVPMELSGRFVAYGASGKRGAEFAAEVYGGKVAGKKIELLVRDVQSESQATISVFNELVTKEKVNYIIGPIGSPTVAAAIPAWRQGKPVWLVPGSSSTKLEEEVGGDPEFFHTFPYAYNYHASVAAALKARLAPGQKIAIVYTDDNYGRTHYPYAKKYLTGAGFEIVAEEIVRTNAADMNPLLTKIARAKPDVIVGLLQTTDAVTLAKQIYTRKMPVPYLIGTAATQLDEWQKAVGPAQEGWVGVTTYLPGLNRPGNKDYPKLFPPSDEWEAAFIKKYGQEPDFEDAGGYVSAMLLFLAIERAGGDDKEKVAAELRKMNIPDTLLGTAKFVETPSGTKQQAFTEMVVFQRENGKNVLLYPPGPATGRLQPVKY